MRLLAAGATDRGPRAVNQDALFIDVELGLLLVADGMGGHKAGEVASQMAVDAVVDFVRATRDGREITWPFPFNPHRSRVFNRMDAALRLANRAVHDAGERTRAHAGMGTTIVAMLLDSERLVLGHVGDSRAYVLRGGRLQQLTADHTLLNALGGHAHLDLAMRHVLTNGIGMATELAPALAEETLTKGERWLLCTDGVHGYLEMNDLEAALKAKSVQEAADGAVRRALAAGTTDNATAVVLSVE
jgi:serine/threonine protein phosphatase PrpC